MRRGDDVKRLVLGGLAVAFACLAGAPAAWAMASCSGSYAAALLSALPQPLVVRLKIFDDSPRNLDLAARFTNGLRQSGISVDGTPTAQLALTVSLSGGNAAAAPVPSSDFTNFEWAGGLNQSSPDQTKFGAAPAPGPQTLLMRAELRRSADAPVAWVGTLQCSVQTGDTRQLAYDLGTIVGGALGKRSERTPF